MNGFTREVPVFLVISETAYNRTASVGSKVKHQDYRSVDIGIAAAYLTAEAQTQGLSTCILGWFDSKKLRQLLDLKGEPRLVVALRLCPDRRDPLRSKKRKSLDNPGRLEVTAFTSREQGVLPMRIAIIG
ncbi:MAG: nitroreductase family protein [Oscillospiraceae bacterium]